MTDRNDADENGVDSRMRIFIQELAATGSWLHSAQEADVNERTPRRWLQTHPGFKALFAEVFGASDIDSYKRQAEILQAKALNVYDESMDAAQIITVKVQCPECGERFTTEYTVPNSGTRLKAADAVSKLTGMLKDTVEHKGKVEIVHLSAVQKSAFLAWETGLPVSPHLLAELREVGLIGPDDQQRLPPGRTIDAEFREIT